VQVLRHGGRSGESQSGGSGSLRPFPLVGEPGVERAMRFAQLAVRQLAQQRRQVQEQLREVKLRIHLVAAAGRGQAGQNRRGSSVSDR